MPDIPDPRMNPVGERAFGSLYNDADGHQYVYIKTDNGDVEQSSRYYTAGTQVKVGKISPAFLVVPTDDIQNYDKIEFENGSPKESAELDQMVRELENCLRECSKFKIVTGFNEKTVIFDLIEIKGLADVNQKVRKELNKAAKIILKDKTKWEKISKEG